MTAREFSYEPARDHSGSTLGLIEMPHELGELGRNAAGVDLRGEDPCPNGVRHLLCEGQLVDGRVVEECREHGEPFDVAGGGVHH